MQRKSGSQAAVNLKSNAGLVLDEEDGFGILS